MVRNDGEAPLTDGQLERESRKAYPFTIGDLESTEVPFRGRKEEILELREMALDLIHKNEEIAMERDKTRKSMVGLRNQLAEANAQNVKLNAVVKNLRAELEKAGLLSPMEEVDRLRAEAKKLNASISSTRIKFQKEHLASMDRMESSLEERRKELEANLNHVEALIMDEQERLADLRAMTGALEESRATSGNVLESAGIPIDRNPMEGVTNSNISATSQGSTGGTERLIQSGNGVPTDDDGEPTPSPSYPSLIPSGMSSVRNETDPNHKDDSIPAMIGESKPSPLDPTGPWDDVHDYEMDVVMDSTRVEAPAVSLDGDGEDGMVSREVSSIIPPLGEAPHVVNPFLMGKH